MSNIGILLLSHGEFAKAALGSAEMIAGKQENAIALALTVDKSMDQFEQEVSLAYQSLASTCSDVVVLCDIYGGTPFNTVSRCILKGMKMIAYTGFSLPLVIDLLLSRDLDEAQVRSKIVETHGMALSPIQVSLQEEDEDLDDL